MKQDFPDDLIREDTREVSMRILSDHTIYTQEIERIFSRIWMLLGHETEIPEPGDFVRRTLGNDSVIVSRTRRGTIAVSLNVCPHRGMRVCIAESGNTAVHRCIYHGWAFREDGSFIGAPIEREKMHGDVYPKSQLGLRQAKVHIYGGLIFATWSADPEPFESYLGDMRYYLDMLFCRTDAGLEVLGPPQRQLIRANWKTAGEQSHGDGFHALTLHRSLMDIGQFGGSNDTIYDNAPSMYGVNVSTDQGHCLRCLPVEMTFSTFMNSDIAKRSLDERLQLAPPQGLPRELLPQLYKHLSKEQIELLASAAPQSGGLFPNINVLFLYGPDVSGELVGCLALHIFVPRAVDRFELYTWFFAEKAASAEAKARMRSVSIQTMGTSGGIEVDDTEAWPLLTESAFGLMGSQSTLKYQARTGEHPTPAHWPHPGRVYEGFSKDDAQWNWWMAYKKAMQG